MYPRRSWTEVEVGLITSVSKLFTELAISDVFITALNGEELREGQIRRLEEVALEYQYDINIKEAALLVIKTYVINKHKIKQKYVVNGEVNF